MIVFFGPLLPLNWRTEKKLKYSISYFNIITDVTGVKSTNIVGAKWTKNWRDKKVALLTILFVDSKCSESNIQYHLLRWVSTIGDNLNISN